MQKMFPFLALAAAALVAPLQQAQAQYPSSFSGTDVVVESTGTDAFGNPWTFNINSGRYGFGLPGVLEGTRTFSGPSSALALYLRFALPGSATIDQTAPSGPGGGELTTRFSNLSSSALWNATFDADGLGVLFEAPDAATVLDNGDRFFVNVLFNDWPTDSRTMSFDGEWRSVAVPEPATFALLGFGLVGLATAARRRRA